MRKLLLVAGVVGTTAACTSLLGDFKLSDSTDGGTGGDGGGGGETSAPACNVTPAAQTAYVGQTVTLTATSTSSNPSFTWNIGNGGSAPMGSNAMVQTSGTTSTLTPDVPGTYTMVLAVSGSGCSSFSTSATLTAYVPSVIFAQGSTATPGGSSATYVVSNQDGGAPSPIMCAVTNTNVASGDDVAHYAAYGGRAFDFWEAPAGTPSNYAAFTIDHSAAGYSSHLWTGTTSSNCTTSMPTDGTTNTFGPGSPQGGPDSFFGSEPSFSPDGSHFVVYDNNLNIVVYVSNSKTHNMVAPYSAGGSFDPSGRGSLYVYPPRVAWQSNSMAVDWARSTSTANEFEIVSAPISTGTVSTVMTCSGVTPREIAVLADGSIIASYRASEGAAENLYHLTGMGCTKTAYTNLTGATDIATDFSVSPADGKTIAFLEQTSGTLCPGQTSSGDAGSEFCPGGNIFIVPVDNSSPPVQIGTDTALYGPRWIGAGTRLVYTRLDSAASTLTAPATSIVTISPSASAPNSQVIGKGDGTTTFASTNGSAACSFGGTAAPSAAGLLSLAALGLVRRRRARRA